VERYWRAQDPYDPATLADIRHPLWSADWPQSNERVPSHDADVAIHTGYPDYPAHSLSRLAGSDEAWQPIPAHLMFVPVRITGASDFWIGEAQLEYPDQGLWHAVLLVELREAQVWRETAYFCRTLPDQPPSGLYPEPLPTPLPGIEASMEHLDVAERRHRDAHARYVELLATDPSAAAQHLFDENAVIDRPQPGRRVIGVSGIAQAHDAQRDLLPGRIRRVSASGHVLVVESLVQATGPQTYRVDILEFAGDKVVKGTEYFAEALPAPEWRRALVERTTEGAP
jgi:hypothetical protein